MTIQSAISVAGSGLRSVTQALTVASQNVANASTPSYGVESTAGTALSGGGVGYGVSTGLTTRDVDLSLEASVFAQNADVAAQQTTSDALAKIDATQGSTAAGNDLASQVGALTDAFNTLGTDPSNAAQQSAVVGAAQALAAGINEAATAYQTGRQTAQDAIVAAVTTLNTTLATIGTLSKQIVSAKALGESTADLENQRDAAESTAAQLAGINFLQQANGDVVALSGANQVDLQATAGPFAIADASLGAGSTAPALTLDGLDVTSGVTSGQIGANIALRDTTLPAAQAGLDEFTQTLATRFANQGLALFTDAAGNVPAGGGATVQSTYTGFANAVQVNPAVIADNALVRDGTNTVAAGTGGAPGFTPNPAGGPASFSTLIDNILNYALGADAQEGVAQTPPASSGLGADGSIALSYETSNTIGGFAASLVGAQSVAVNQASTALATSTSLQSTLQSRLQAGSGVSIDTELSNLIILQNAYGANAKVLTAAESLWTDLYTAVTTIQ